KSDLVGLPEGVIEAAAQEAEKKGHAGKWLFNLQAPSFIPFMQYAQNRELRKKLWMAYNTRAFRDSFDNQELVKKIVRFRHERAELLGFTTHADFVLSERMAQSTEKVMDFLNKLLVPSRKAADRDIAELRSFKKSLDGNDEVMPWDFAYYSEKLREKKFKYSEEELRPFFQLENVIEGVFEHARRLYGLTFREVVDVPKYHPDVRTFEVREERTNNYVGLFYTDFFPRETKKSGAWMTAYREQGYSNGHVRRPHVSIVCNFTKPTASKPSLLTYDEVQTLFHEFGHALHGLLSQCTYRSLAGTNVYWDFVELPSQIMENWVREKEGLDIFARHYKTKQAIPPELVEKIKKSSQFQSGYSSMRQLQFALLDMAWHSQNPTLISEVDIFETKVTDPVRVLPKIPGTNSSVGFSHIFAGGYSAGYYSYKWAEVLDADAFEYFQEHGLFNREIADKFRNFVLSRGGTEHPMDLYKKFRGREPDPQALLRREGLISL
ncbi:MAG: peptidase M3, partial [Bdellovibrio sp. CG10_big_fil_rev_8_21_14_0_10_47_8]